MQGWLESEQDVIATSSLVHMESSACYFARVLRVLHANMNIGRQDRIGKHGYGKQYV